MQPLTPVLRWTFAGFAGLALIAGALLTFGADDTADWFSWTILPPITAAALGAYYWGAFALLWAAAAAPGWRAARPIAYPVLVIALVLLAVTLVHLDKFDLDSLFGIFWLCAYIAAPALLAYGIATQGAPGDARGPGLSPALRAALAAEGAVLLAAAALLLLAPDTAADAWPWSLTPLTSRALGAFALGVALVALWVAREDELVLFRGMAAAYFALGALQVLAVAVHSGDLGDDEVLNGLYLGFWTAVLVTGAYGLRAASASSRS